VPESAASRLNGGLRASLAAPTEVLVDDSCQDDEGAEHAQQIGVADALVGRTQPLRNRLVEREQHERDSKGEEQAVAVLRQKRAKNPAPTAKPMATAPAATVRDANNLATLRE
jgi:hypothetical protein